jgi:ribosomal protein S18 acetylase RimI-like enzyme
MMQHGYVLLDGEGQPMRCTASLIHLAPKMSLITGVEVAYSLRNLGYGTKVLLKVLDDADKEGVTLILSVASDDSPGSLSNDELRKWYEDYGFYQIPGKQGNGVTMKRLPNTNQEHT